MISKPFQVLSALLLISAAAASAVSRTSTAASWEKNPLLEGASEDVFARLRETRAKIEQDGCDVNVCFTIDGSGSISRSDFQDEKNFVDLIGNIISTDRPISFCGVQYSTVTTPISPLTDDRADFLQKVRRARQAGGGTNLAAALGYAGSQLFQKVGDANKIIVLGDGLSNIGFAPQFVAAPFLALNGSISAVAIGNSNVDELARVTGDRTKVFYIQEFFLLIQVVNDIVKQTCGLN